MILVISSAYAQKQLVFSTHNTAVNKICSRILIEAYQKIGLKINIESYPSKRSLIMANTGRVDGEVCRVEGIDKDYSNLVMVPVGLQSFDAVVFTNKQDLSISGWSDLNPYRIGLMRGAILAHQYTEGMTVHSGTHLDQLLLMLYKNRLDVVVTERHMGISIIKQLSLDGITIIEPPLVVFNSYHYVHKKHAAFIPSLVKVLKEMKTSRMKEIQDIVYSDMY